MTPDPLGLPGEHELHRFDGYEAGFVAGALRTFAPNPHPLGSPAFDHWADGYDIGRLEARSISGVPANDNVGVRG